MIVDTSGATTLDWHRRSRMQRSVRLASAPDMTARKRHAQKTHLREANNMSIVTAAYRFMLVALTLGAGALVLMGQPVQA